MAKKDTKKVAKKPVKKIAPKKEEEKVLGEDEIEEEETEEIVVAVPKKGAKVTIELPEDEELEATDEKPAADDSILGEDDGEEDELGLDDDEVDPFRDKWEE